ncbi:uncharacterized protein [Magallana gigas]|uniref:uncharacterized protein n=1 Tax=Magallana gigas TaxID=29159 RepID=UPI003342473D
MPWSNFVLAGSMVFSGIDTTKCLRFFAILEFPQSLHQSLTESSQVMLQLYLHGTSIRPSCSTIMREWHCDSPGVSDKFGPNTLMAVETGRVVDFQLVQSNEVAGSTQMELEGLQRFENAGLHVQTLVTYIHIIVKKLMRIEHHKKKHYLSGIWAS